MLLPRRLRAAPDPCSPGGSKEQGSAAFLDGMRCASSAQAAPTSAKLALGELKAVGVRASSTTCACEAGRPSQSRVSAHAGTGLSVLACELRCAWSWNQLPSATGQLAGAGGLQQCKRACNSEAPGETHLAPVRPHCDAAVHGFDLQCAPPVPRAPLGKFSTFWTSTFQT